MRETILENEALYVAVDPLYGGRVLSFVDKGTGREWLVQGRRSPNIGEDAAYGREEAVGWDECFPTVGPFDASATPWRRRLRDHGDLWGRPWSVDEIGPDRLTTIFNGKEFRFTRALRLNGPRLSASYAVENLLAEPLPFLWAQHALLSVGPGDRIELPEGTITRVTFAVLGNKLLDAAAVSWEGVGLPFAPNVVQPTDREFAAKFLARAPGGRIARIGQPGPWLEIAWDHAIENLGIWLVYGGWPERGQRSEVALEAATADADHLGEAIAAGAAPLAPRATRRWSVTFRAAR
jgi:hypothetical protein